jgi:hypothetical protein
MLVSMNSPGPWMERSTWLSAAKLTTARGSVLGQQAADQGAVANVALHPLVAFASPCKLANVSGLPA